MSATSQEIPEALVAARERSGKAWQKFSRAEREANEAGAEVIRLELLEIAARHPEIIAFDFEVESVYDDEGGYYPSIYNHPHIDESKIPNDGEYEDPVDEVTDINISLGELAVLAGHDKWEVSITPAELRDKSF